MIPHAPLPAVVWRTLLWLFIRISALEWIGFLALHMFRPSLKFSYSDHECVEVNNLTECLKSRDSLHCNLRDNN